MNTALESQPLGKLMLKFCLPCIASLLISCFYNIIDQMFVGNGIGYVANAATGIIFPLTVLGWGLSLWFGDGAAATYSLKLGQDSKTRLGRYAGQVLWTVFFFGLTVTILFWLFPSTLLHLAGAAETTYEMSFQYGLIILSFMPLAMVQNALAPLIRANSSPAYALFAMVCGALFNIVGDYLTVLVWHMGIQGAAWATVLGQLLSFLLCIGYFLRPADRLLFWKDLKPDWSLVVQMARLGFSSLIAQLSVVVITIVNNILLVYYGSLSRYGSEIPLAAFVVLMKLFQLVINCAIGIAAGAQPIAGVNFAVGNPERVRRLFMMVCLSTFAISALASIAFFAVPQVFVNMFGAQDSLYVHFAVRVVRIYLSCMILTCLQKVCAIYTQSVGLAGKAAFLSVLRDGLLVVFSILFPLIGGLDGIFLAAPGADLAAAVVTAFMMIRVFQQMPALIRSRLQHASV